MTAEEWIANIASEQDRKYAREAVNAALEKERAGEVVLCKGTLDILANDECSWIEAEIPEDIADKVAGRMGSLIFREEGK